ncbi:hypothetical protein ANN_19067 [Periplaneta americana]|uniref:Uncharacterized protein n=1 Tax=Periplaneta americana TaxID=6978 RepID=A0ABQ8SQG6_PERAM|nr:hypothetical protein ANN_19067 [Periplaneta americana]
MPRSPRKQRATVVKLVTKYGVPLENKVLAITRERLSDDVTNLITEFYVNDEISRVDPSLKGVSSQRFITTARRHLLYPIREVHNLFCRNIQTRKLVVAKQFNLSNLTWTFFATSHGKGAVDGIGAVVKRKVWNLVRARKVTVRDAETFARACSSLKVNVLHVKSEEINSVTQKLGKPWENTLPITRTQKIQHVIAVSAYKIKYKYFPQNSSELEEYLCPEIRKRRRKRPFHHK